jgi:hypothetical protein
VVRGVVIGIPGDVLISEEGRMGVGVESVRFREFGEAK